MLIDIPRQPRKSGDHVLYCKEFSKVLSNPKATAIGIDRNARAATSILMRIFGVNRVSRAARKTRTATASALRKLALGGRRWTVRGHMGATFLLDSVSLVDRSILLNGGWEEAQIAYLMDTARGFVGGRSDAIFIDAGAYFGLYAALMRKSGLFADVYAFESNPVNFAQLQATLLLNGMVGTVVARNVAVTDRAGLSATDYPIPENRGGINIAALPEAGGELPFTFTVSNLMLDTAFSGVCGRRIVMKFDLQGHERQALAGAEALVRNNDVLLQIEIENPRDRALSSQIDRMGFRMTHVRHPDFVFVKQ
jgi:FkbM family methyltransferase